MNVMKRLFGILIWIVIACGFIYGVYYLYTKFWSEENLEKITGEVKSAATENVKGFASDAIESLSLSVKKGIGNAISSLGETIFDFGVGVVGEELENKILTAKKDEKVDVNKIEPLPTFNGGTVSISSPSGFTLEGGSISPFASILIKKENQFSLLLNYKIEYQIDWGDGKIESGKMEEEKTKLLSHTWSDVGEYAVKINIKDDESSEKSYSFPVFVYEN